MMGHEANYANAQSEHKYRSFLLFVRHPQRFLYNQNYGESRLQDLQMEVAAKIAEVPFVEKNFKDKWRVQVLKLFRHVTQLRAICNAAFFSQAYVETPLKANPLHEKVYIR